MLPHPFPSPHDSGIPCCSTKMEPSLCVLRCYAPQDPAPVKLRPHGPLTPSLTNSNQTLQSLHDLTRRTASSPPWYPPKDINLTLRLATSHAVALSKDMFYHISARRELHRPRRGEGRPCTSACRRAVVVMSQCCPLAQPLLDGFGFVRQVRSLLRLEPPTESLDQAVRESLRNLRRA